MSTDDKLRDEANVENLETKYGDCHIFNYQKFLAGPSLDRPGSEKDVARLTHDFKELNFNVSSYINLTKKDTLDELIKASEKDHKQSKCFVCCFLTHGKDGSLLMHDDYLNIDDILAYFSRSACKSLAGKPKIFIFQACRGKQRDEGRKIVKTNDSDSTDSPDSFTNNPDYLDFLLVYSTYGDHVAFRRKDEGSYFIDELCRTLEQFSKDSDLLQILTLVNYRVARMFVSINMKKQMPGFTSRLRTEVKFNREIQKSSELDTTYFDKRRMELSLGLKSTEKPLEDKKIYKIQKPQRVKFLFFLNMINNFEEDLLSSASSLWSSVTKRGYQSEVFSNWSIKELMDFLEEVQKFSNTDCSICFIACQAEGDYLYDVDGEKFKKKEIVEKFIRKECENLRGKPKIFIFLTSPTISTWESIMFLDSTDSEDTIPVHSDLLEIAITIQELKQLEGVTEKFCNIFGKESSEDFLSQLTRMFDELVKEYEFYSSSKNMSSIYLNSTLTETLILNKPLKKI